MAAKTKTTQIADGFCQTTKTLVVHKTRGIIAFKEDWQNDDDYDDSRERLSSEELAEVAFIEVTFRFPLEIFEPTKIVVEIPKTVIPKRSPKVKIRPNIRKLEV